MNISVQSAMPCLCKGPDSQVRVGERMIKDTKGKKAFFSFHRDLHVYLVFYWLVRLSSFF